MICFLISPLYVVFFVQAKELVESTPATLMKDMKKEEAEKLVATLKELGGEVELE